MRRRLLTQSLNEMHRISNHYSRTTAAVLTASDPILSRQWMESAELYHFTGFTSCIILSEVIILEARTGNKRGVKSRCPCIPVAHFRFN